MNTQSDLTLPIPLSEALTPLLQVLPLTAAMPALVPSSPAEAEALEAAEEVLRQPMISGNPALQAGVWLYVDELERSHALSQGIDDPTGSFWHAIMHRREGDFSNAKYWLRQAGSHPVWASLPGYEPYGFVDEVARRHRENPAELVEMQRAEWVHLMRFGHDDVGGL
ncbi:MAG TPA: hypothetical protein VM328_12650 [Fimbriimonadaceae bacterium]|nr:hypothetical protein [Fimbriimonadaceae bacterium]